MEAAIGLAASIVTVIEVTSKTITYLNDVRTSSEERKRLSNEVADLYGRLTTLKCRIEDPNATDPWFQAVQGLTTPLAHFKAAMTELSSRLTEKRGVDKMVASFRWTLDKKAVLGYLAEVERMKSLIIWALQEDLMSLAVAIKADTYQINKDLPNLAQDASALRAHADAGKVQQITTWLSPLNFLITQDDVLARRQPNTGQWFLDSQLFRSWVSGNGATLWCPGIPGAGKTVMTSIVIDWLRNQHQEHPHIRVAVVYCSYQDRDNQSVFNLLAGIWRQILHPNTVHSEDVQKLYETYSKEGRPRLDVLMKVVSTEVQRHSKVFVVVDALDELSENARGDLVCRLRSLQPTVNLLVTSRKLGSIAEEFTNQPQLEIDAKHEDIITYIQARVSQDAKLSRAARRSPNLEVDIKTQILEKSQKMFLLAHLYMDSLASKESVGDIRRALQNLPTGLEAAYDDALERIESTGQSELALKILYWTSSANRPLQLDELLHGLAVRPQDRDFNEDNIPLDDVASICAGLVEVDQTSKVVRLAHYTTQDYLQRVQKMRLPNAANEITSACLTYLSFDKLIGDLCENETVHHVRARYPLLDYAACNWGRHMLVCSPQDQQLHARSLEFLRKKHRVSDHLVELEMAKMIMRWGNHSTSRGDLSGFHVVVFFNLIRVGQSLLESEKIPDDKNKALGSPLDWAASLNRSEMAKVLIDHGADVNESGPFPWKALHLAATHGHLEMVRLLLDCGADPNVKMDTQPGYYHVLGQTPLHEACWNNKLDVAELLVEHGADVNVENIRGETPLIWVVTLPWHRSDELFSLMVRNGSRLTHRKLLAQVIRGPSAPKRLQELIDHGVDVNQPCGPEGDREYSALDYALEAENTELVGLLVRSGAHPRIPWYKEEREVQRCVEHSWFHILGPMLLAARENAGSEVSGGHAFKFREDMVIVNSNARECLYLEVEITAQPVEKIVFKTVSHDQGWSDYHQDHGTYSQSSSWFEADIMGAASTCPRQVIQYNLHAVGDWKTHVNIWDRATASKGRRLWMDGLTVGTTLRVFGRALYQGWENHIKMVHVEVYGKGSVEQDTEGLANLSVSTRPA